MLSNQPCSSVLHVIDNARLFTSMSDNSYYVNCCSGIKKEQGGSGGGAAPDFLAGSDLCGTVGPKPYKNFQKIFLLEAHVP
jgi:hypothetical protein